MKTFPMPLLAAGLFGVALPINTEAQAVSPAPASTATAAGRLNDALRKQNEAFSRWDIGGSARVRYEVKEGYGIPGIPGSMDFRDHGADVGNDYFLEKLRLRAGYGGGVWGAFVEGESSLAQGDQRFAYANTPAVPGTRVRRGKGPESDTIELHQAGVTLGDPNTFPLTLKLGRQELAYGDERLVGAVGWNNIGRTFDAAKLRWENGWFVADAFVSRPVIPQDPVFDVSNDYETFSGVYATTLRVPKHLLDVYFLARNASTQAAAAVASPQFPQPGARDIYTAGFRLKSKPGELGAWDYLVESAYQGGNFADTRPGAATPVGRLEHSAFMATVQGGYTFKEQWAKPRFSLEYVYSSGDEDPLDREHGTFDNLFPTNHKFYGAMDLVSLQNIHNTRAGITLKPTANWTLNLDGHGFWLADTRDSFYNVAGLARGGTGATAGTGYGLNPAYGSFVGTELNLVAAYTVARGAVLEVGYGHFFPGDYIESSLAHPDFGAGGADFVYAQFNFQF